MSELLSTSEFSEFFFSRELFLTIFEEIVTRAKFTNMNIVYSSRENFTNST